MKKIVLLPLDERPCNFRFPKELFDCPSFHVVRPDALGDKKIPADVDAIEAFLMDECKDADGLVVAMDTLLYGGLIPSRLHTLAPEEVARRMDVLSRIRALNPNIQIFAFLCIMRCPRYSSNDEEPDYYEECGAEIHQLGICQHRRENGEEGAELDAREDELHAKIDWEYLSDYTSRRAANCAMNLRALSLVEEGVIDFLTIPQDDSAPLGYTAMDQARVRLAIRERGLQQKVLVYPGADEVAMTLLSRMRNHLEGKKPSIFVQYASEHAWSMIPLYEDRPFGETLKCHIQAAGCRRAQTPESADFILAVTAPADEILGCGVQPHLHINYDVKRNLPQMMDEVLYQMQQGKPVAICDNSYCNGGDLELLQMMNNADVLMKVAGYAGWNTSANTLGTVMSQAVQYLYEGSDARHLNFLALRYAEDCGYCSTVKLDMIKYDLEKHGMNYFDVFESDGIASEIATTRMKEFVKTSLSSIAEHVVVEKVRLPWRRVFEADVHVTYKP